MFDLHSHILPGVDDGAVSVEAALDMARAWVDQGVQVVAATPHILPGVYHNTGQAIREAVGDLQVRIDEAGIALRVVPGADNHIAPNFVAGLAAGRLLAINDTRYVLVEPPHPERLSWIRDGYAEVCALHDRGVLMQVTASSVTGAFGDKPRYWAERMLGEGRVDILASDAHDPARRPPNLAAGHAKAAALIGREEADNLVTHRPRAILENADPKTLPSIRPTQTAEEFHHAPRRDAVAEPASGSLVGRLRRLIG
jgi:protein-tyrosine phosphatase